MVRGEKGCIYVYDNPTISLLFVLIGSIVLSSHEAIHLGSQLIHCHKFVQQLLTDAESCPSRQNSMLFCPLPEFLPIKLDNGDQGQSECTSWRRQGAIFDGTRLSSKGTSCCSGIKLTWCFRLRYSCRMSLKLQNDHVILFILNIK